MAKTYYRKAISKNLSNEIEEMVSKIKEVFNLDISKIQASKIIAWKSHNSNAPINKNRLVDILGSVDE